MVSLPPGVERVEIQRVEMGILLHVRIRDASGRLRDYQVTATTYDEAVAAIDQQYRNQEQK